MSAQKPTVGREWLDRALDDFRVASHLLELEESPAAIGFHLQQAVEKALKAYLLSKGWSLRRIPDLEILLNEATVFSPHLGHFADVCRRINPYYLEQRYPGLGTKLSAEQVRQDRQEALPLLKALGLEWEE